MPKLIKRETVTHREAFEAYYGLGEARSYREIARRFDASVTSVNRWSQSFKWLERITQRDARIGDALAHKAELEQIKSREDVLDVLSRKIDDLIVIGADGKPHLTVPITDFSEFNQLVKLFLLLRGDPTENTLIRVEYVEVVVNYVISVIGKHVHDPSVIAMIQRDLQDMPKITAGKDITKRSREDE